MELCEVPDPVPGEGEVLIDVQAAGVTFPEVLLARGKYQVKPPLPFTPGSEVAGIVRSAPPSSAFKPGQRVAAFPGFGGFAERVTAPVLRVFALPDAVSMTEGAALPMNAFTVHFALTRRAQLKAGETVLVQGAAGGIGVATVQLAKALGARVLAVVSTEEKERVVRQAGADEVLRLDNFLVRAKELTQGRGVDVVMDPVGGERFLDSLRSLAPEGRLLVVGFAGGDIPQVRVNRLLLANTDVRGVGWGSFILQHPEYMQQQWQELLPLLPRLRPVIGTTYPLAEARRAVADLEERRAAGKVVLLP